MSAPPARRTIGCSFTSDSEHVHGAFISDDEVNRICDAWRERGEPNYVDEILTPYDEEPTSRGFEDGDGGSDRDALYDRCVSFVLETRKASTSSAQRKFSLGYNRAARIIDQMEENGICQRHGRQWQTRYFSLIVICISMMTCLFTC